jgi:UDP-glucose 4-epimerase
MRATGGRVVITGGAGYIGQVLAVYLAERGYKPTVVDVRRPAAGTNAAVIQGDIADPTTWAAALAGPPVEAVFHCAGLIQVAESVQDPNRYFAENVGKSIAMMGHLRRLAPVPVIFSSSAAVYGNPGTVPIPETSPASPTSAYGVTKRQFEEVLDWHFRAHGQPYAALRYFNAAGSYGGIREQHRPETHLLPSVWERLRAGQAPVIFGDDYPTRDGTAIRDFVHVRDLAEAHLKALHYLQAGHASTVINLGSGTGVSVGEAVDALRRSANREIRTEIRPRRSGDPAVLVADIRRAQEILEWEPAWSSIQAIVRDYTTQTAE